MGISVVHALRSELRISTHQVVKLIIEHDIKTAIATGSTYTVVAHLTKAVVKVYKGMKESNNSSETDVTGEKAYAGFGKHQFKQ